MSVDRRRTLLVRPARTSSTPPLDPAYEALRALSIVAFLVYGTACVATDRMVAEFERYGLPGLRRLTGSLEIAGGLGLLVGVWWPPLGIAAAAGLCALMAAGTWTRVRIRDSLRETLPAFSLMLVNGYLCAWPLLGRSADS